MDPSPPTSERAEDTMAYRTLIHILGDDSLLQIFSCFRLEDEESWNPRFTWRKLVHVCRRWRYLIFDFPSHLDMCIPLSVLTNDSPSTNTLSYLPPLLLVIDYYRTTAMTKKDEDNLRLELQEHGRVRGVVLRASSSSLRMCLGQMNQLFPKLRVLSLFSTTTEEIGLVLPETFQAPDLRRLSLHGLSLPKGLPFLSSMTALSTLTLSHIRHSFYFPPGHLVTQLQGLPHLEELSIGFATCSSSEEELIPVPIPSMTLPILRRLTFRGEDIYLDSIVAQINTPLLERLSLTFFFDLAFTLANLTEFIHRTNGFGCLVARIIFNKDGASIDAGNYEQGGIGKLSLHVNCESPDWQISSATQVCSALGDVLSAVEELTLDLDMDAMQSDWENTLDSTLWHELLLPFIVVKKLHIGSSLALKLSEALQSIPEGLVLKLLPKLQELDVQLKMNDARVAFSAFLHTRRSLGRPVALSILSLKYQLIIDNALDRYKKHTRKDLLAHPLTSQLQACDSPGAFLTVLQQQVQGQDQSRSDDRWIKWLDPTVNVLFAFSATLEAGVGMVPSPASVVFAGIGVLLSVAKDVRESQDTLLDIFERIEMFFRRLEVYTEGPQTMEMMDLFIQILVEVLSIIGIATKEIRQGRTKKYLKKLVGRTDMEDALKKLDKLTYEDARMAVAQNLKVTHTVDEGVMGVANMVAAMDNRAAGVDDRVA